MGGAIGGFGNALYPLVKSLDGWISKVKTGLALVEKEVPWRKDALVAGAITAAGAMSSSTTNSASITASSTTQKYEHDTSASGDF